MIICFFPSLEEVKEIAKNQEYKRIPVYCELFSDIATPIEVLRTLKGVSNHTYMLESVEESKKWGRYSFLGFDPILELTCQNGAVTIKGDKNSDTLNDILKQLKPKIPVKYSKLCLRRTSLQNLSSCFHLPEVLWDILLMTISNTQSQV